MASQQIATRQLTDKQTAFVTALIETGDAATAAELAGFRDRPSKEAWRLLRIPHVLAALNTAVAAALAEDAPLARNLLRQYVKDDSMNPKIRLDAAKTLLDRAGHIAPKAKDQSAGHEKPLNEMSTEELRALADRFEAELAGRAKLVSADGPGTDLLA
jgi:phage terminase small subunit